MYCYIFPPKIPHLIQFSVTNSNGVLAAGILSTGLFMIWFK